MTPEDVRLAALAAFQQAGAHPVELPVLQSAATILDLYGEDIRARAYTARDPLAGELMLRPDFTLPVVEMHLERGAPTARYAYSGQVFRIQDLNTARPNEYEQVGIEFFGEGDLAAADAEVFAIFSNLLSGFDLRVATGDIGILRAAVERLTTSERRKRALLRHLWRPGRFRKLLDWFSGAATRTRVARTNSATQIGLRSPDEISARLAALEADAAEAPIPAREAERINAILELRAPLPHAVDRLANLIGETSSVEQMRDRLVALTDHGIDPSQLEFEGSYGRTNMEYYDGFVFGFFADQRPMPPVATGGRYDALTKALGRPVPAVGGMLRPALIAELTQ